MKSRCYCPGSTPYKHYGAKGITVCDDWLSSFLNFYNWALLSGWCEGMSIERVKNELGYSPENCTVIKKDKQNANRRSNLYFIFNGERKILTEWCSLLNMNYGAVHRRLTLGWDFEEAITTPIKVYNSTLTNKT